MRILQVRFKNLNSLVGEWRIDFTFPAYVNDGIFAITGPTGAGKTTILDAICLGLYGRTPRLNKITKNENEIMSRQTGECFAEVTFETQSGRFCSHWSQHRTRKKPGGELQPPKHEIADADSGRIFEIKQRGVAKQIEAVAGMDFNRFTRSMLLAQGDFSAFLQATPDERAPILEQITGTEIYSQISIRVHERRSEERNKLDTLLLELVGMQLLSIDDEQQLNTSLAHKVQLDTELTQQLAEKNKAIIWLDGVARLKQEMKIVAEQKQHWQIRKEAFAPRQEKLEKAIRALELAGDYAALKSLRYEQETDHRHHGECLRVFPSHVEAKKNAEKAMKQGVAHLDKKKIEQKEMSFIIREVRALDLKLQEKDAPMKATEDTIAALEKSLSALRGKHDEDCLRLENKKKAFKVVEKCLVETQADETLVEHLTGIRGRADTLNNLHEQQNANADETKTARIQLESAIQYWNDQIARLENQKSGCNAIQNMLHQKKCEFAKTLENGDLTGWRDSMSMLKARGMLLNKVSESFQSLTELRRLGRELTSRHDALAVEQTNLAQQIQTQIDRHASLEREMNLLETQFSLLKKIQDFEDARHQLQDGAPCPLCGAREHPFTEGNVPVSDETKAALDKVRADLKVTNSAISDLKIQQAEVRKDIEQNIIRQKECADHVSASELFINQSKEDLSIAEFNQDLGKVLQSLQNENSNKLRDAEKIVKAAETIEKEMAALRESLEKARESVALTERKTQNAAHQKDSATQLLDRLTGEAKKLHAQHQQALSVLHQSLSTYGIKLLSVEEIPRILLELTVRRDQWMAQLKEKQSLAQQISALEIHIGHQKEQIAYSDAELIKQRKKLSDLQYERKAFVLQRQKLFDDKNPDIEEKQLFETIEIAEKNLENVRQTLNMAHGELSKLQDRIESLDKSMAMRNNQLKLSSEAFIHSLNRLGFADETDYISACLPEDERKDLMQQSQRLTIQQTELFSRERDKKNQLETECQKGLTDLSREALEREIANLLTNQKVIQQEIGGIRQKLTENETLKQRQHLRAQAVDAQKRECSRWNLLHELIGSADGKKYRNFAQGLTFEMMIGHANRQLQKMTDRYLLVRDNKQPLALNIIDNYQAGVIRSTKNLSGGESFIVSLSLALGLSHMASKNVRVDSLFLDEGFGTLDEEALDTALETLARLQQDGKLIGVISHVPALKERISTQIQVTSQNGGRSVISGPGCGQSAH